MLEKEVTKVKVISSPLIRCLQTSAKVCNEIDVDHIEVRYEFIEWIVEHCIPMRLEEIEFNQV